MTRLIISIQFVLESELRELKNEISEKEHKIAELQNLLEKSKQDIITRDDAILFKKVFG